MLQMAVKQCNTAETSALIQIVCVTFVHMNPIGSIYLSLQLPDELCVSNPIKNSQSPADSAALHGALIKKSYSHSNSHTSLHYISHCKYGIKLSWASKI